MLAVVKMPRTKNPELEIRGNIPSWMILRLKKDYGANLEVYEDNDEKLVNVFDTDWFKSRTEKLTPGTNMRIYRENMNLTQSQLGEKLGNIPRQNISSMEKDRRGISKEIAKKLSALFNVPIERFI